jgi:hypothetical protein
MASSVPSVEAEEAVSGFRLLQPKAKTKLMMRRSFKVWINLSKANNFG